VLSELPAVLAAFAVLTALGDRVLLAVAVGRVARRIQLASGSSTAPDVRIGGIAFLPQLIAGLYRDVQVTVGAWTAGGLDSSGLTARLGQVRAPLRLLLAGGGVTVGQLAAEVMVPLTVLARRLPSGLTLRPQGGDLRITGTILLVPVTGTLGIRFGPAKITFTPKLTGVPAPVGFVLDLPALPHGLAITGVRVTDDGLAVAVRGTDVTLGSQR
jgi:DUF2993 family protein